MKTLILICVLCLPTPFCTAVYRNYDQHFPSSYISRYAYGGKYNVPGTYNYGYPQRYAYQESNNRVYYTPPVQRPALVHMPVSLAYQY